MKTCVDILLYASKSGRIYTIGGAMLNHRLRADGYMVVSSQGKDWYVHRLVCGAFHGPAPTPLHHVDHIDRNRSNNRPTNLRWILPCENLARRVFKRTRVRPAPTEPVHPIMKKLWRPDHAD